MPSPIVRRALQVSMMVSWLAGCDPAAVSLDAGSRDGAIDDARGLDAPPSDAPLSDAPPSDAPPSDGPASDAASDLDGASTVDAGDVDPPGTWRSALFPRDWRPLHEGGVADAEGRFLPDFSYAGWHRGEARPPIGEILVGTVHEIDASLGDGTTDATAGIQRVFDEVCAAGGGVAHLPAGTFRVRLPSASATAALRVTCSHFVLRGDGPDRSRILFDDAARARDTAVLSVRGPGSIYDSGSTTTWALADDLPAETRSLTLATDPGFAVGDWLVVRNDVTDGFRSDHRMDAATSGESGLWPASSFRGLLYLRRVVALAGRLVTLDAPIRYALRTRDAARVYRAPALLEEVGLEAFSIGMVENRATSGGAESSHDDDYTTAGTTGYEVHQSRAIELDRIHDAWIADVDTFAPAGNATGAHVLSSGILLSTGSTRVTILDSDLGRAQYRGGGGNGYLFHLTGSDALVRTSSASDARHGFIFNQAVSGNVFRDIVIHRSRLTDDAHRFLAHANLYDRVTLDSSWLSGVNRGTTSSGAGFTATAHVFWATHVDVGHPTAAGCAIESAQFGHGYLIGSSAAPGASARLCPMSFTNSTWAALDQGAPTDWVEGEGRGATLYPPSLHEAQRQLRCAREGVPCRSW